MMNKYIILIVIAAFMTLTAPVQAQDIKVGNDGPVIITLAEDASSVIVGNPANASVVLDNPRRIMVNAGAPGMTRLTVLNVDGKVIFNRNLVVGAGGNGVIRIQNACINAAGGSCTPEVTYQCAEGQRCNRTMPASAVDGGAAPQTGYSVPPSNTQGMIEE